MSSKRFAVTAVLYKIIKVSFGLDIGCLLYRIWRDIPIKFVGNE